MAGAGPRRRDPWGRAGGVRRLPDRAARHPSVVAGGGARMSELPESKGYQYVVLRCVPRVDREEFVNVGVVLYCQATDYLAVRWHVDRERLGA
ncbi:DUF3037 domain-containing protein, partial [Nocardioides sp.]|uniref:DUF3037 domain-containing protein n=1 Tax=Nocardioides sp. TaxID=35761 RepID=UPI00356514E3